MALQSPSFNFYRNEQRKIKNEISSAEQAITEYENTSQPLYMKKVFYGDNDVDDQLAINKAGIKHQQQIIQKKTQELIDFEKKYDNYGEMDFRRLDKGWYVYLEEMKK
jgi:hypothetical protein